MVVGVLQVELYLHGCGSLKEKRSRVRSLLARLRHRYPVSAAEVGCQDSWQSALVGFSLTGTSQRHLAPVFDRLEEEILRSGEMDIQDSCVEWLHF